MKLIIKLVFKIHRLIYKYPTTSEIRLALNEIPISRFDLTETVGMLYICNSTVAEVADWLSMDKKEVITRLNTLADKVKL
jgi:hypothetical protein